MNRFKKGILLILLLTSSYSLADIRQELLKLAEFRNGHAKLIRHSFSKNLEKGNFRREQIAMFLNDRAYILKVMEDFLPDSGQDLSKLPTKDRVLYRSHVYRNEFTHLVGNFVSYNVSDETKSYGEYLQRSSREIVFLHLYLFLVGETEGGQSISSWINTKFPKVGKLMINFENTDLQTVQQWHQEWIEGQLGKTSLDNYKQEVARVLSEAKIRFDLLERLPRVSLFHSFRTVCSEQYYDFFW